MPTITYIEPSGETVAVDLAPGWTLMQGAMHHGIDGVEAQCGGSCACATCHCYVEAGGQDLPLLDMEAGMLDSVAAERRSNSRLACQLVPTSDMTVRFPDRQT
ncbi:2Fe-2S iron-sulfur cluster-binding protein [Xanthomonas sp. A1809]|uniref:2Fe-2S iron-sulfur cluster-binding protein n=1 Tax=Xanthomonas sp. A1809 TaxID=2821275 RepID=UPI001AD9CCF6|nr:2Fe-2S iron-sulfur cluster-binding protein [Xanthomonas sp. A1809]MBO9857672.1 (2Fe-2S)-binding protein [Xanthomonas sp. A1809]